jgi:fructose transport system substrate-binding protein
MTTTLKTLLLSGAAAIAFTGVAQAQATGDITACLITKTDTNPFFVKMREGATEAPPKPRASRLQTYAGTIDGDVESQVAAVETCIAAGASGILITPVRQPRAGTGHHPGARGGPAGHRARHTLRADRHGRRDLCHRQFRGRPPDRRMGRRDAGRCRRRCAKIATLDLNPSQVSVDYLRNQGFMTGFGIDVNDPTRIGDEDDARIVGSDVTNGNEEGGRTAMENLLQIDNPASTSSTRSTNPPPPVPMRRSTPSAWPTGADRVGRWRLPRCAGRGRRHHRRDLDAVPAAHGALGIEAIVSYAETDGTLPANTEGLDFFNTGVMLVTDAPVDGIDSITSAEALELCWG